MRMPVLGYFVVVGSLLLGLLYWTGDNGASEGSAFKTSQTVGIPKSIAPQQQPLPEITTVNFASEYDQSQPKATMPVERKPAKSAATKRKDRTAAGHRSIWNRFVEYPHDNLSIH